jgi:hypothetical protein
LEKLNDDTLLASVQAVHRFGSQSAAGKALGLAQSTLSKHLAEARARGLYREHGGSVEVLQAKQAPLPTKGSKRVYYLTCAQNNTKLHEEWWKNLKALVAHDEAELMVSVFKYNKDAMGQRAAAKSDSEYQGKKAKQPQYRTREEELAAEYPADILPFICDDRIDLAPNLTFCGELNVMPTASNPLEGLENYTFRKSTIVPHPKLAMTSIPTMKTEGVKLMYTTGCVTQRNYIKRKVGYKAEHFHAYGALIVEVDEKGSWFVRQVIQGPDGSAHDLDRRAINGKVEYQKLTEKHPSGVFVEDVTWGDVHADKEDPVVSDISYGKRKDSMLEVLRPRSQHVHDLLDFSPRSHHTRKDPWQVFESHVKGKWEMTQELVGTADVLWNRIDRPWCNTFVVNSNHDRHLDIFCKQVDWREDPSNAKMILTLNLVKLQAIEAGRDCNLMEVALTVGQDKLNLEPDPRRPGRVRFLKEDESHVILPDIDGGIECGVHGDRGSNGAKGSIATFAKVDRKMNTADKHFAGIQNHAYQCGVTGRLDMGYNHGLSSWTHAHIVTYVNGTRAIVSIWKGKWRA